MPCVDCGLLALCSYGPHVLSVFLESCSRSLCVSHSLLQLFYSKDCELHDSKQASAGNAILAALQSVHIHLQKRQYSDLECFSCLEQSVPAAFIYFMKQYVDISNMVLEQIFAFWVFIYNSALGLRVGVENGF